MRGKLIYLAFLAVTGLCWALPVHQSALLFFTAVSIYLFIRIPNEGKILLIVTFMCFFAFGQRTEIDQVSIFSGKETQFF
ncbi:MAG TPA: hypothetical protein VEY51_03025, partial [Chondromyces sp.]|nr:hypothetical protein [Chondromyces sp.]